MMRRAMICYGLIKLCDEKHRKDFAGEFAN